MIWRTLTGKLQSMKMHWHCWARKEKGLKWLLNPKLLNRIKELRKFNNFSMKTKTWEEKLPISKSESKTLMKWRKKYSLMSPECLKWPLKSKGSTEKDRKWTDWVKTTKAWRGNSTNSVRELTNMSTKWKWSPKKSKDSITLLKTKTKKSKI